jgi:hypothetical protein
MTENTLGIDTSLTRGYIIYHNEQQVEFASNELLAKSIVRKAWEKGIELTYAKV